MQSNTSQPLFTLITSTLNAMDSVERCVESVSVQTFDNYEYIVVDGASTDGTAEFLNSRKELFSVLISEPDTGIYNAWNKALKHARGEWILFLGADDVLADERVLSDASAFIKENKAVSGIVYGDIMLISRRTHQDRERLSLSPDRMCSCSWLDLTPAIPPHPAVFHHKALFAHASFDESYRISADSKLLLSFLWKNEFPSRYFPRIINRMTVGGVSSLIGFKAFFEDVRALRELGIPVHFPGLCWSVSKICVKNLFRKVMGERRTYRIIDSVRRMKGKAPIWEE